MGLAAARGLAQALRLGRGIKQGARAASRTKQLGKINKTRMAAGFADDAAAATAQGGGFLGGIPRMAGAVLQHPFVGGAVGIGSFGLLGAGLYGQVRSDAITDMIETGRGTSGNYDRGPLGVKNLLALPSDQKLDQDRSRYLQDQLAPELSVLRRGGFADEAVVNPEISLDANRAQLASMLDEAQTNIDIKKATAQYMSGPQAMERDRQDTIRQEANDRLDAQIATQNAMTRRQLEAGISQAEKQLSMSELQLNLAGQQQQRQQALDLYREQNRADEAKYRNRVELMQGLSTLAMGAFS